MNAHCTLQNDAGLAKPKKVTKKNKETGKKETVEVEVKRLKRNYTDLDTKILKHLFFIFLGYV